MPGLRLAGFFDQLAACFDPVVGGIARKREPMAALGEEIGAQADFLVGGLRGLAN